jgi:hypothetical protein
MMYTRQFRAAKRIACLALVMIASSVAADEVPMVTGEHWTKSSPTVQKAYLIGIANVLQIESAYQGENPPSDSQSVVPRFVKGIKGQTLDSVRDELNRWYAEHPNELRRPVLGIIWFEIVVPGLQKATEKKTP